MTLEYVELMHPRYTVCGVWNVIRGICIIISNPQSLTKVVWFAYIWIGISLQTQKCSKGDVCEMVNVNFSIQFIGPIRLEFIATGCIKAGFEFKLSYLKHKKKPEPIFFFRERVSDRFLLFLLAFSWGNFTV